MRMIKKYPIFHSVYALIFILVLLSASSQWQMLSYAINPCISLVLIGFLGLTTKLSGRFHQRLFTGLVFALTGDTLALLHRYDPAYFLYGLLAFLVSHVFYISAFYLDFLSAKELDKKGARIAIGGCFVVFSAYYFYLRPHLGILKLPVLVYIFISALMVMMAAFRNQRVNSISFKLVMAGVWVFVGSDAILAYNHFVHPFPFSGVLICFTYMVAQYLIILGGVERKLIHTQTAL